MLCIYCFGIINESCSILKQVWWLVSSYMVDHKECSFVSVISIAYSFENNILSLYVFIKMIETGVKDIWFDQCHCSLICIVVSYPDLTITKRVRPLFCTKAIQNEDSHALFTFLQFDCDIDWIYIIIGSAIWFKRPMQNDIDIWIPIRRFWCNFWCGYRWAQYRLLFCSYSIMLLLLSQKQEENDQGLTNVLVV